MSTISECLTAYSDLELSNANEAETRLKLIDRVLFEVLGWSHDDVSVESRVSEDGETTFADYIVKTAGSAFVVEAKKLGTTFRDVPDLRRTRLAGAIVQGPTGHAIKQARDYCRKRAVPFAVVTNGSQWIVFPAVRVDQVSFADSAAVIFPSLRSALQDDYSDFFRLLAREQVIAGSLELELLGRSEDQLGERRLRNFFTNRGSSTIRNPLYPLIEDAIVTAFTDSIIDSSPELLSKCYVQTPERIKFDRQIGMYISKRQSVFRTAPIRPLSRKDAGDLRDTIENSVRAARPIAILVLGSVGSGKTTFLHYTRNVSSAAFFAKPEAAACPHWIYVDFRDFPASSSVPQFLYDAMKSYASNDWFLSNYEQCIRPAYRDQIRALREGPLKPISGNEERINEKIADYLLAQFERPEHIDRVLSYAASKAPIFLVIDNVDQFEGTDNQSAIFSECMAVAHKNRLNMVLALREVTFVKHRSSPIFDAFDFAPIAIDPPAIPAVLSKRFFLAKQILTGRSGEFIAENGANVVVSDLSIVADLIQSSVLGTKVGEVIDVLSTSDVRLALRMTREFLESGYTNPGRAINIYRSTGSYILPRHEALRSVLLGSHPVYSEEYSIIANPFDAHFARTNQQLLRLFLLSALVSMSSEPDFRYAEGIEIRDAMRKLGFGDAITQKLLEDLCGARFAFTSSHTKPTLGSSFYPSRLGGYVVRFLMADSTFLEAVLMDTFIADKTTWDYLKSLSEQIESERDVVARLKLRHERIRRYFSTMQIQYMLVLAEAQRRSLGKEWCNNPFEAMGPSLDRHLRAALLSAQRNYGRVRRA
jgi:hypothetical protein